MIGAWNGVFAQQTVASAAATPAASVSASFQPAVDTASEPRWHRRVTTAALTIKDTAQAKNPTAQNDGDSAAASEAAATHAPELAKGLQLIGNVSLVAGSGQELEAGELVDTLVYFVPSQRAASAEAGSYTVYTHNREFTPEAIAIPQGSTVTFVNLDDVRHNVFSVAQGASFNLGFQAAGEKASHVFSKSGLILVGCNVHRSMELDMLVVPSRYIAKVASNGSFVLHGLPAGTGTLSFWNPRADMVSQKITVPTAAPVKQVLTAVRERMVTQLNTGDTP